MAWKPIPFLLFTCLLQFHISIGQTDSTKTSLKEKLKKRVQFTADTRMRIEYDWDSMRADSTMRSDRTRFRFRLRFGASYTHKWAKMGFRIRAGNLTDQQGPHVTLGGGTGEFGLIGLGFEKAYFQGSWNWGKAWIGKNTFPFYKMNELFWNDNVYPDGVALSTKFDSKDNLFSGVDVTLGHFILHAGGKHFDTDRYFQGAQIVGRFWDDRIKLLPSFYYFNAAPNIPDGMGTYNVEYSILHSALEITPRKEYPRITIGAEHYVNLAELNRNDSIPAQLRDQKNGLVGSLKIGQIKGKGDWTVELYYAYLQRFSVVDYFAQNDWARWDYSYANARGSRLTNSQGFEIRVGYSPLNNLTLILRGYMMKQLVKEGIALEDGNRIRLDLNFGF